MQDSNIIRIALYKKTGICYGAAEDSFKCFTIHKI